MIKIKSDKKTSIKKLMTLLVITNSKLLKNNRPLIQPTVLYYYQ